MDSSISITATTNTDSRITTTISNANPMAADNDLRELAVKVNALTTNSISSIKRVNTTDITNANTKTTPTITLSRQPDGSTTDTFATVSEHLAVWEYIVTNSDGTPYIKKNTAYCSANIIIEESDGERIFVVTSSNKDPQQIWDDSATHYDDHGNQLSKVGYIKQDSITAETARIVVGIDETDNYNSVEAVLYIKYA